MRLRSTFLATATAVLLVTGLLAAPGALAARPSQITGVITDTSGHPVNTCVTVYDSLSGEPVGSGCTDNAGAYTVGGLSVGTAYKVYVASDGRHIDRWFDDVNNIWDATEVVAPGTANLSVPLGGTLKGTLTAQSGAPASGFSVQIWDLAGTYVTETSTDEAGHWSFLLPAGGYKVEFTNDASVDMWYAQQFSEDDANPVTTRAGQVTTADARIVSQGAIVGKVTNASGVPLKNISACAFAGALDWSGLDYNGCGTTGADGTYRIQLTAPGSYLVQFMDRGNRGYVGVFTGGTRDEARARRVAVPRIGDVTLDQTLSKGATITGKVVVAGTGRPLAQTGASPSGPPITSDGQRWVWGAGGHLTGSDGIYVINGLPTGAYKIWLTPSDLGYAGQWYLGATTQADATPVQVTAHQTVRLKTVRFVPGATVSGVVTDTAGKPMSGAYVDLSGLYSTRLGGLQNGPWTTTDADGRYSVVAPVGTYRPIAYVNDDVHAPVWWGGASTSTTAKVLPVRTLRDVTADFVLPLGAHIVGTVNFDAGAPPNPSAFVDVYNTAGDVIGESFPAQGTGAFRSTPLPAAGDYLLHGEVSDSSGHPFLETWYDGKTSQATATVVHLAKGQTKRITFHFPWPPGQSTRGDGTSQPG